MHKYRGGNGKASGKDPMAFDTLLIIRLVAASLIFAAALVLGNLPGFVSVILLVLSAVVAGYDIALDAVSDFSDRDFFSTSVVVTAITVVSCIIGFPAEAAALVLLYQIGLILVSYAEEKSRLSAIGLLRYHENSVSETVAKIVFRDGAGHTGLEDSIRESAGFVLKIGMIIGALYAVITPLFTNNTFTVSIHRAITIILISTPMSVVISMPTAGIMGMCFSAEYGVIFGSAAVMERCAGAKTVLFDNAGVFFREDSANIRIMPELIDKKTFLTFAAHVLYYSGQPEAKAILHAFSSECRLELIKNFADHPGYGAEADIADNHVLIGKREFFDSRGIDIKSSDSDERRFHMTIAGRYVGCFTVSFPVLEGGENIVAGLKENGVSRCVLLCEESDGESRRTADELDFREVYGECDSERKYRIVKDISDSVKGSSVFVYADGAEMHSAADVDMHVSKETSFADAMILPDCIVNIPFAFSVCRRVREIAVENAVFVFVVKAILIFLSIIGYCNLWFAIFIDMVAAVGTILNTVRVTGPSLISRFMERDN